MEICRIYARAFRIQTICFLFAALGPSPQAKVADEDFPPFYLVWKDLQHACRLALEIESVPDHFQVFNMLSYLGHEKYLIGKARQILGFEPTEEWESLFKRKP